MHERFTFLLRLQSTWEPAENNIEKQDLYMIGFPFSFLHIHIHYCIINTPRSFQDFK